MPCLTVSEVTSALLCPLVGTISTVYLVDSELIQLFQSVRLVEKSMIELFLNDLSDATYTYQDQVCGGRRSPRHPGSPNSLFPF